MCQKTVQHDLQINALLSLSQAFHNHISVLWGPNPKGLPGSEYIFVQRELWKPDELLSSGAEASQLSQDSNTSDL